MAQPPAAYLGGIHLVDDHNNEEGGSVSVSFRVEHVEKVRGAGRLHAIAVVSVDVDGVEMRIHGVRIVRQPTGLLAVEAPQFRRPGGEWVPAVTLPPELKDAIAAEILDVVENLSTRNPLKPD